MSSADAQEDYLCTLLGKSATLSRLRSCQLSSTPNTNLNFVNDRSTYGLQVLHIQLDACRKIALQSGDGCLVLGKSTLEALYKPFLRHFTSRELARVS